MNDELSLPGDTPCLDRAARWLRVKTGRGEYMTIFEEFEQEFNCTIIADSREDPWAYPELVKFKSKEDLLMFVLRWS
jgi:hypothetical protein